MKRLSIEESLAEGLALGGNPLDVTDTLVAVKTISGDTDWGQAEAVRLSVFNGDFLVDALRSQPNTTSKWFRNMVAIGERTDSLADVGKASQAVFQRREERTRLGAFVFLYFLLLTYLLAALCGNFLRLFQPGPDVALSVTSDQGAAFIVSMGLEQKTITLHTIFVVLMIAFFFFFIYRPSKRLLFRTLPGFRLVFRLRRASDVARGLATMVRFSERLSNAVRIAGTLSGSKRTAKRFATASNRIAGGTNFASAMMDAGYIGRLLATGLTSTTGDMLDSEFDRRARRLAMRADRAERVVRTVFWGVGLAAMATLVAWVLIGFYTSLPIGGLDAGASWR